MTVRVLVVDDSGFFRRRVCEILNATGDIKVIATASNGREALDLVPKHKPDVITMDYEMPVMDGITAVRQIMQDCPTPVLMFSSLTYEGARVTFDALEAGAVDFLPKSFEDLTGKGDKIQKLLHDRILAVARSGKARGSASTATAAPSAPSEAAAPSAATPQPAARKQPEPQPPSKPSVQPVPSPARSPAAPGSASRPVAAQTQRKPLAATAPAAKPAPAISRRNGKLDVNLVLIGTSTGGPVALQKILTRLPANFPVPIVLVQHMPATFTPAFAERLNRLCQLNVKQIENGEVMKAGSAYIAPGGKQTLIERSGHSPKARILEGEERLHYKPCVDVTFGSAAKMFASKVLGIILTGMGADGREGCRLLKQAGATIWSQDEQTSVIYGMPMAVAQAGLTDEVLALDEFAPRLADGVG